MMKSIDEFVVHCKSQEEWDAVLEYYGAKGTFPTFDIHSRNCLRTTYTRRGDKFSLGFADLKFFEHHLIISFEEFSERFLNKNGGSDMPKITPDISGQCPITMQELLKSNVNEFMMKVKQVGGNPSDLLNEYFDLIYQISANGLKMELTKVRKGE